MKDFLKCLLIHTIVFHKNLLSDDLFRQFAIEFLIYLPLVHLRRKYGDPHKGKTHNKKQSRQSSSQFGI